MPKLIRIRLKPNINHNNNSCAHTYLIERVIMDHPRGGVVVLGDDNRFHVVHKKCVGDRKREIFL